MGNSRHSKHKVLKHRHQEHGILKPPSSVIGLSKSQERHNTVHWDSEREDSKYQEYILNTSKALESSSSQNNSNPYSSSPQNQESYDGSTDEEDYKNKEFSRYQNNTDVYQLRASHTVHARTVKTSSCREFSALKENNMNPAAGGLTLYRDTRFPFDPDIAYPQYFHGNAEGPQAGKVDEDLLQN